MLVLNIKDDIKEAHKNKVNPNLKQYKDVMRQLAGLVGSETSLSRIPPTLRKKEPMQNGDPRKTNKPIMRDMVDQPAEPGQEQISSIWAKSRKYARYTYNFFPFHNLLAYCLMFSPFIIVLV